MTPSRWNRLLLASLLAVFLLRIGLTWRVFNDTTDEGGHIVAGLAFLERGVYDIEAEHPPLGRLAVAALPYWLAGLRLGDQNALWSGGVWSRREPAYYWLTLALARAGNVVFAVILFLVVYRWSCLLYDRRTALVACVLVICCPNVLAHASVATVDMAVTATVLLAAFCLWRWAENPGWLGALGAGGAVGLAALSKYSAPFFLAPMAVAYLAAARWNRPCRRWGLALLRGAVFALAAAVVIWAGYGFDVGSLAKPGHQFHSAFERQPPEPGLPWLLSRTLENWTLPAPKFFEGLIDVLHHNERGHGSYLLGRISREGWWYYFPLALGVKTTLPLLLLLMLSLGRWAGERVIPRGLVYPILAMAAILGVSMGGRLNIGIRHVLALYPLMAITGAGLLGAASGQAARAAALVLVSWHAVESLAAHPDYLPYFNQIARGREERFLIDSNLDWGQDLARLAEFVERKRLPGVQLRYFGMTEPSALHLPHTELDWQHLRPGWVAISVNHLVGILGDRREAGWLRERTPEARIGKSIRLYNLTAEEARRFSAAHQ